MVVTSTQSIVFRNCPVRFLTMGVSVGEHRSVPNSINKKVNPLVGGIPVSV